MTEAAVVDTGCYRHRCQKPKETAGQRGADSIGDRLPMCGTADPRCWDRKARVGLGLFRSWRMTVESVAADPRPAGCQLSTIGNSGTGADPLRTYLSSSRALGDNGPRLLMGEATDGWMKTAVRSTYRYSA